MEDMEMKLKRGVIAILCSTYEIIVLYLTGSFMVWSDVSLYHAFVPMKSLISCMLTYRDDMFDLVSLVGGSGNDIVITN